VGKVVVGDCDGAAAGAIDGDAVGEHVIGPQVSGQAVRAAL